MRSERRVLQLTVAVLALVPVLAGAIGIVCGLTVFGAGVVGSTSGESQGRYLSGLALAVGLAFWVTVPRIESQGAQFRLLTGLVLVGGLGRLYALWLFGLPPIGMLAGLVLELIVTPALAIWRERLERRIPS
jgi:Domain of unknown function (DUF4345)